MTSFIQRSFAGGEIAPAVYARTDQVKYQTGLKTCRNFKVQRHGGVANRAGTYFVAEVKDSTKLARLLPFAFNADQTYVLEFGHQTMRPIRAAAQLADLVKNITAATQANPVVLTSAGHTFSNGDEVYIAAVGGMTQLNGRNFKLAGVTANTFQLQTMAGVNLDGTAFGAYTSGGTASRIYTIATPYDQADVNASELQYVQSADVVTLVHPSYAPRDLGRSGHTNWTLSTITFAPTIAAPIGQSATGGAAGAATVTYQITAVASETYEESLPSGNATLASIIDPPTAAAPIVISWTAVAGAQEYNVYKVRNGVAGFIGVAGSNTFNDIGYTPDTLSTPPQARNPFGSTNNYPSTVTYFQQRRVFANTNNDTEKVWATRIGMFKNLCISTPLQDDDAVTFRIPGRQVNAVRHLFEIGKLVVLTSGGEYTVEGDAAGTLTPVAINPRQQGYSGSAPIAPILIGNNAIFLQARGMIVKDLRYDINVSGYVGRDLTVFAAHLFEGYQIVAWAYQQVPDSIVWVVRSDGALLGLTYLREHEIWGWHQHDTDGLFEDVCVIPEGDEDAVYFIVNRNGKRYIERMHSRRITDIAVDAFFVDCGLTYDGRNTTATTMSLPTFDPGYLYLDGTAGNYASTLDSATVSITGDIDIRVKVAPTVWSDVNLINKASYLVGEQRSFYCSVDGRYMHWEWSTDGTVGSVVNVYSTIDLPPEFVDGSTQWLRVTHDVDNGLGANTVTFYTSSDGEVWTVLGSPIVSSGTTSIFDSTTHVELGSVLDGLTYLFAGKYFYASVRNGINGTLVAEFNPDRDATDGAASVVSSTTGETWTLTGSTAAIVRPYDWTRGPVPLQSSAAFFTAADVGNAIELSIGNETIRVDILSYTNSTNVVGNPSKTVPVSMRGVPTAVWSKAVDQLTGLWHLEGYTVAILADGNVVANGSDGTIYTIVNGQLSPSLDRPYSIIHCGLPYTCDIETLEIDTPNAETKSDKQKFINNVTLHVQESRGIFAGADADHLEEFAQRTDESYGEPTRLLTGKAEIPILTSWNDHGRIFVRQKDPLPLTILAAIPAGFTGG